MGIHDFKGSDGWLDRWKSRHNVTFKTVCGEALSCTKEMTSAWDETTLPTILSQYELGDIYNADEFGLFYKALPSQSLQLKSEKCTGGKLSKVRVTGLAAANAVGEKLPMFVIGKSAKPRCFKGVKNLPCRYRSQRKSWMDSSLFEEWVRDLDWKFEIEKRKIALTVDNCPAHPQIENLRAVNLIFLPSNTTCQTQPMDQGVIRSTKAYYRRMVVQKYIDAINRKKSIPKLTVLDAMDLLVTAWDRVSTETIKNCCKKAGISRETQENAINDSDDPFKALAEEINELREKEPELVPTDMTVDDVVDADDNVLTSNVLPPNDEDILQEIQTASTASVDEVEDEEDEDLEVTEEPPKPPSKSDIRIALNTLSLHSMFVDHDSADKIRKNTRQLSSLIEKNFLQRYSQQSLTAYFRRSSPSDVNLDS